MAMTLTHNHILCVCVSCCACAAMVRMAPPSGPPSTQQVRRDALQTAQPLHTSAQPQDEERLISQAFSMPCVLRVGQHCCIWHCGA
jgi:hypothetical protein